MPQLTQSLQRPRSHLASLSRRTPAGKLKTRAPGRSRHFAKRWRSCCVGAGRTGAALARCLGKVRGNGLLQFKHVRKGEFFCKVWRDLKIKMEAREIRRKRMKNGKVQIKLKDERMRKKKCIRERGEG